MDGSLSVIGRYSNGREFGEARDDGGCADEAVVDGISWKFVLTAFRIPICRFTSKEVYLFYVLCPLCIL